MTSCWVCGSHLDARSDPDHRMFWAIMQAAFDNWPEAHPFKPDDRDHLYGWILIEVGHRRCAEVETTDKSIALRVAEAMFEIAADEVHSVRVFGTASGIRVCVPRSLKYEAVGKREFQRVRSAVYEVIEATLGVSIESLKRERSA